MWDISEYWGRGTQPIPLGTANRMSAPYQAVKSKPTAISSWAPPTRSSGRSCARRSGRPALLDDPRFPTNPARLANREVLIEELEKGFVTRTSDEWVEALLAAGVPAGTMYTYPEAFEREHGRHRHMRMEIDHPNEGKVSNIGFAVKLTGTPQQVRRHPPLLGQHTLAGNPSTRSASTARPLEDLAARGAFRPMSRRSHVPPTPAALLTRARSASHRRRGRPPRLRPAGRAQRHDLAHG